MEVHFEFYAQYYATFGVAIPPLSVHQAGELRDAQADPLGPQFAKSCLMHLQEVLVALNKKYCILGDTCKVKHIKVPGLKLLAAFLEGWRFYWSGLGPAGGWCDPNCGCAWAAVSKAIEGCTEAQLHSRKPSESESNARI